MTSEQSNDLIYSNLEKLKFLGFKNLFVFPQKDLPGFTETGLITMSSRSSVHLFPNGSGGLFNCIKSFNLLNHM
jgi:UDP-N-acetylglucosamine pyrophosphorylase